jgi:glycosyltransferase involved in cell wall biosynthesis
MKPYYITITPFFPTPTNFRGPFIYDQIKAINKTGKYEVVVFKPKTWYSSESDYEYQGVKVYRFKTFELPSNILPGLFDFLSRWSLHRKLKTIGIKTQEVAIAHAHVNSLGVFATALKKSNPLIKTIVQHHGFDVLSLENGILSRKNWHRNWVKKYNVTICNAIDVQVGVSAKTLEFLTNYPEIKVKKKYVLYNGLDTEKFYPISGSKDSTYFTIGCVGNFWPLKDQITLLKAIKILVDEGVVAIRIKFVGTGETLDLCKQYVTNNKLEGYIEFIEELPHNQLVYFYNTLDLFVLPSYHEAFGCVYTEAYACGVPFIAVEGQGIAEMIPESDHSKWLIKKEDYKGLAELIREKTKFNTIQNLIQSVDIQCQINHFFIFLDKEKN